MSDVGELKRDAAELLGKKGRRVDMIFYCLILIFAVIAPIFFFYYIWNLVFVGMSYSTLDTQVAEIISFAVALVLSIALAIFAGLPVICGYFKYSYKVYKEGMAGEATYFSREKGSYRRSLLGGILIGIFLAACASPLIVLVNFLRPLATHPDKRISALVTYLFFLAIAAGLALGLCVFLLFRPMFLFCYYISRGIGVGRAISLSVKRMRDVRAKRLYMSYVKAFLPDMLLSLVTLLIFFVVDALPRMTLVYHRVADEIAFDEEE